MKSQKIQIAHKHNFSETFYSQISDIKKLNVILDDIKADNNINVEIKQFYSIFPIYEKLQTKLISIQNQLEGTDNYQLRIELGNELNQVRKEVIQFRVDLLLTAHSITNIKYSDTIQEVANLFFNGDLEKAYNKLNPIQLETNQQYIIKLLQNDVKLEKTRDNLEDNANEFKVKAQLTILNFDIIDSEDRFQKAIFFFEKAKESAKFCGRQSFYSDFIFDFALFLQKHNKFEKAKDLYEENIEINRQITRNSKYTILELPSIADALNNLASLQKDTNKFDLAIKNYEEALDIYEYLSEFGFNSYRIDYAMTMNNLANLYADENKLEFALNKYKQALIICQSMDKESPGAYSPNVAKILKNLAVLYVDMNESNLAFETYEEALKVYKILAKTKPNNYLPYLASTMYSFAILLKNENKFVQACEYFDKTLKIRKRLAKENPTIYMPLLANTLNSFANLHSRKQEKELALEKYQNALYIRRELAKVNPTVYLPNVAETLNNLALTQMEIKEYTLALENFQESLKIRRAFAKSNPDVYMPSVMLALTSLSLFYVHAIPDKSKSKILAKEAIKIGQKFQNIPYLLKYLKVAKKILHNNDGNL